LFVILFSVLYSETSPNIPELEDLSKKICFINVNGSIFPAPASTDMYQDTQV
jgi:hypothetical protein